MPAAAPGAAHTPVLVEQVLAALAPRAPGLYVDGTLGAGGHAIALLEHAPDGARLLGVDRDAETLRRTALALRRRYGDRFEPLHADFRALPARLAERGERGHVRGILLDLGVSSLQLDDPERGLSFQTKGPLDMRFDRSAGPTAADLVNAATESELVRVLRQLGEEPAARSIAHAIVRARPFADTLQLAAVVARAARRPPRRGHHPATRTFQALRIAVNRELEGLGDCLRDLVDCLAGGARLAVIAFHSLEDRIVKRTFRSLTRRCVCPPELPVCTCGTPGSVRLLWRRVVRPEWPEVQRNPRARSARLRAVEKLAAEEPNDG